jgi:V/A-type H+/Na+-transporting ATPase subunit I
MSRPVEMSLLKISIHQSQISAFLNEIPNLKYFQIREFTESTKTNSHYHRRREKNIISNEMEMINHKVNEIEENLIYLMLKLDIDPLKIKIPEKKYVIKIENLEELIDILHEKTTNESRRLKGMFKDLVKYQERLDLNNHLIKLLSWLSKYNINSKVFDHFKRLQFGVFFIKKESFHSIEVALEHADIPVVLQYDKLDTSTMAFFLIYNKQHENSISEMIHTSNCSENQKFKDFLTEKGIDIEKIEEDIEFCKARIKKAQKSIEDFQNKTIKYRAYQEILENCRKYIHMEQQFLSTSLNQIVKIEAFVPTTDEQKISEMFIRKFRNRIRITAYPAKHNQFLDKESENEEDNEEDESINDSLDNKEDNYLKGIKIPSLVMTKKIFKPFKILVNLYGTTNYNELDPAPILAFTYPLLFGLMFGDFGHGLVLILTGLLMIFFKRKDKENTLYDFGFLFVWLGVAAALAGLFYGEFFGYEFIIPGIHYANPMHDIMKIFKLAILIGVVHICLGWFLSVVNFILKKRSFLALDPIFKILLLGCGTYLIFTWGFAIDEWLSPPYPILLAMLPALGILLAKPIGKTLFRVQYLQKESLGEMIGESAMDVGETYLSILSNVASYSRLLALAMAHMGLMLIVTTLVETLSNYDFLVVIILIGGNLFVIVLEGTLAFIHALRLHLYEFFGKFYLADGVLYTTTNIKSDYSEIIFTGE